MTAPSPPSDPRPEPASWARRIAWHRIGYILSALWVGGVLFATGGNVRHPLFNYIFLVPLAGWVVGMLVARLLDRRPKTPPRV